MRFRVVNERVQKNSGDSFYSHKVVVIANQSRNKIFNDGSFS